MEINYSRHHDDFHRLRTHLTMIKGNAQLAHRAAQIVNDAYPRLTTYLELVLTHVEQLTMLVAEMEARELPGGAGEANEREQQGQPEHQ